MSDKVHHGHKWMPCMYFTLYGILIEIARKHGYALAVHGSLTRDMDLIAVPWIEHVSSHLELLAEIYESVGINKVDGTLPYSSIEIRPHGRIAYTIPTGGGGYVDISIMNIK